VKLTAKIVGEFPQELLLKSELKTDWKKEWNVAVGKKSGHRGGEIIVIIQLVQSQSKQRITRAVMASLVSGLSYIRPSSEENPNSLRSV
jgi:hypothetical protein